jgi:ABC-type transport system substrate-binding protein
VAPVFNVISNSFPFRPPNHGDLIVQLAFNGLYRYESERLEAVPDLAAEPCDIAADNVTITCTLVNTTFHDGTPLTADDVVFTYELVRAHPNECSPDLGGLGFSSCLDMLDTVVAKDERTVEFRLKAPNATFFTLVLPNVMIDSRANVEASYQPLADRASTLDPDAFDELAGQMYKDLSPEPPTPPDCGHVDAADALLTSAGLPTYPHEQFALDGAAFDACLYSEFVAERLVGTAASLRTTGLDAISAAYPALSLNQHPVGTGPFRFAGMVDRNLARFEAFDGYHFGRPAAPGVDVLFTHDDAVIADGLQSGAINWAPLGLNRPLYVQVKDAPNLQFAAYPAEAYGFVGYNIRPGALFADKVLRSALELCVDKPATVAAATNGEGDVIYSPTDPISWAFQPDLRHPERDVAAAKELIESAGWTLGADGIYVRDGKRLSASIVAPTSDIARTTFLDLLTDQVRQCGIEIISILADSDTVLGPVLTYPHLIPGTDQPADAVFIYYAHGFDPDDQAWSSQSISSEENPRGGNFMGFSNPKVDSLLAEGIATYDQRERARIYRDFQDVLADEQPVLFTWGQRASEALDARLRQTDGPIDLGSRMWWWELEKLTLAP